VFAARTLSFASCFCAYIHMHAHTRKMTELSLSHATHLPKPFCVQSEVF